MASIHSMTGFGAASRETEECRIDVEVRTVNNRFLKFINKVPEELNPYQAEMEKALRTHIRRGTVYCTVRFQALGEVPCRINWNAVNKYFIECQGAITRVPIADAVTVDTLLTLPGVVEPRPQSVAREHVLILQEVVNEALFELLNMRRIEGEQIKNDCIAKKDEIEAALVRIKACAPKVTSPS